MSVPMTLHTNVFENGEWVTRTLEPRELLRETISPGPSKTKLQSAMPPTYGVLTKTIIESPVFHWVLPVQLRSSRHNDVAFIGDNFVQVCELDRSVQLQNIARKQDFGSRIRNVCVIGSPSHGHDSGVRETHRKTEDEDEDMGILRPHSSLPPQLLVIVLERGDLVFLYIEEDTHGEPFFVSHSELIPSPSLITPGYHLTVDPSSRYLALACSETFVQVWNLESMNKLRSQHERGLPFRPTLGMPRTLSVRGVIHKIEFLSPGADSEENFILALIIIHNGVSKLHKFEWELGENIPLTEGNRGWQIDRDYQLPLLFIPSTVRESFLLVTETGAAWWGTLQTGAMDGRSVEIEEQNQTELHIGGNAPLWTAWSRPWRLHEFYAENDTIWLAREDGVLNFLEMTAGQGLLTTVIMGEVKSKMGEVKSKIDTAFACLWDPVGDVIITGGDSGPGAIWRADPRQAPVNIGTIPNWSPTIDITSTNSESRLSAGSRLTGAGARGHTDDGLHVKPDQLFVCSGRGQTGSIAELRYGLEAQVGFEMDHGEPIKQSWTMRSLTRASGAVFYLLIAFPSTTEVFHVNLDTYEVENTNDKRFDLTSTTLAAMELQDGTIVQVTAGAVNIISATNNGTRHDVKDLVNDVGTVITAAAISANLLALSLHTGSSYCVRTFRVEGANLIQGAEYEMAGEVTCVGLVRTVEASCLLVGIWDAAQTWLMVYSTAALSQHQPENSVRLDLASLVLTSSGGGGDYLDSPSMEALTSIESQQDEHGNMMIHVGTRSGEVLTLMSDPSKPQGFRGACSKFGFSAAHVYPMSTATEASSLLVCCDTSLYMLTDPSKRGKYGFKNKHRVLVTGADSDPTSSPELNSVSRMQQSLWPSTGKPMLTLISGSSVYISQLQVLPKPVLRHLPVLGTPKKVMYHPRLDALVVAVLQDGRPTLQFLDPRTGRDLSRPTDRQGNGVEHITGLGRYGTQIIALTNWNFEKDGHTWGYIVVSVRSSDGKGSLLIITATREDIGSREAEPSPIRFFTKTKRPTPEPVFSIAPESQGLFLCIGTTIQYEVLEAEEKRLKKVKEYFLKSPAAWMEVVDDKLHVVTAQHSLEVVDFRASPESEKMTRIYSDDRTKISTHCIEAVDTSAKGHHEPITLLSDIYCGVWGMWASRHGEGPLKTVFLAELQASVRHFARARARPQWSALGRQVKYGCVRGSPDGADIVGMSIDGSLRHFTVLSADAWRLLRFLQNLASRAPDICPPSAAAALPSRENGGDSQDDWMEADWNPEPKTQPILNMQVDGDILQRCLDKQALEGLVISTGYADRLKELLDAFEGGKHTQRFQGAELPEYLELTYDILEYYLSPVL